MVVKSPKHPNRQADLIPKKQHRNKRILLMGNPNVGKSVIFSGLSGTPAESANYAGTTAAFTTGKIKLDEALYDLIDVPGTYSLNATCEAEELAIYFLKQGAEAILCVLDATNLVRSIRFALELQQYRIPTVYVLNLVDVAKRYGITVDQNQLEKELNGPVIPTIAVKRSGFTAIVDSLRDLVSASTVSPVSSNVSRPSPEQIVNKVQRICKTNRPMMDKLGDMMVHPIWGVLIAIVILSISILLIIGGGELLIEKICKPLSQIFIEFFRSSLSVLFPHGFWHDALIGEYGVLVTSFEWILSSILPYVLLYYAVFSFLEDCGYLPRLAVLFDHVMSKLGVQGSNLVSILLGYGCAVPAIIGSRSAGSRKERIIIACMVCFAVPCTSQTGALIRLFHGQPIWCLPLLLALSLVMMVLLAFLLSKILKGTVQPMVLEVPHLLLPNARSYADKLTMKMKHFLLDAEFPMLFAVLLVAVLSASQVLPKIGEWCAPIVVNWLGLPKEASVALITGILRREMAVAPLLELNLSTLQVFVGATVALFYLPCISVFAVLSKELGLKTAVLIGVLTFLNAFLMGGLVHFVGQLF